MGEKLAGKMVDDSGRERGIGSVGIKADDVSKAVCQHCDVAVVTATELAREECMRPMSVYG